MRLFRSFVATALLAVAGVTSAQVPLTGDVYLTSGDLVFLANGAEIRFTGTDPGGLDTSHLAGAYVKSIAADGTVVLQDANGDEQTIIL